MENTFFGQPLDCPDEYFTLWHTCPVCHKSICYCDCQNHEEMTKELTNLYINKFIDPFKSYPELDAIAHEMFMILSGGSDHITLSAEWVIENASN